MTEETQFPGFTFPGSAVTLVRRGGITNYHLIACSVSNISAKNYQNRLMCVEVIVGYICVVFSTQCVLMALCQQCQCLKACCIRKASCSCCLVTMFKKVPIKFLWHAGQLLCWRTFAKEWSHSFSTAVCGSAY